MPLVVLLMSACGQEDREGSRSSEGVAVCFSVNDDGPTVRGASTAPSVFHAGGIGVFAFYQKAKSNGYPVDFNKNIGEPTFMYNQELTTADGGVHWTYAPTKYWPNNVNDQLSFFAYAPYDPSTAWEDLKMESNYDGTKISRRYVVEDEVADQQDYLWADPVLNRRKTATATSFVFTHLCARIGVTAKLADASSDVYATIDNLVIKGNFLTSGTMVYTPSDEMRAWQNLDGGGTLKNYTIFKASYDEHGGYHTFEIGTDAVPGTEEVSVPDANGYVFVIPGTQDITLVADVSRRSKTGGTIVGTTQIEQNFPAMTLEENKIYKFLLNISLTDGS